VSLSVLQSMLFDYCSESGLMDPACRPPPRFLFTVFNGGQSEFPPCPSSLHFILSAEANITTTFSSNFLFHCHLNYGFKCTTVAYQTIACLAGQSIKCRCTVSMCQTILAFLFHYRIVFYVFVPLLPVCLHHC
jgi:hypothetical protein